jgi:hypothetical protein
MLGNSNNLNQSSKKAPIYNESISVTIHLASLPHLRGFFFLLANTATTAIATGLQKPWQQLANYRAQQQFKSVKASQNEFIYYATATL